MLRECTSCAVYVCQDCIKENPPCTCSHCEVNYLCPNCARQRERDGTCRRTEEENARREQKWKNDMEVLESILERKFANEVIEFAGEFFSYVEDRGDAVNEEGEELPYDSGAGGPEVALDVDDTPLYYD